MMASDYVARRGSTRTGVISHSVLQNYTRERAARPRHSAQSHKSEASVPLSLRGELSRIHVMRPPRGIPTPTLLENKKPEHSL